jgi:superfamily II DNA/RNA helicase
MPRNFRRFNNNNGRSSTSSRGGYGGGRSNGSGGRGRYNKPQSRVNFNDYIRPAKKIEPEQAYAPQFKFSDFEISDLLKKNLANIGFESPTQIQDLTIPLGLAGKDVIGIANTGTGKTAAFGIPLLNKLISESGSRALIIAPTRELAEQIQEELRNFAKNSGLYAALLIGGQPMRPQLEQLKVKPNLVIGTPGRVLDHVKRGTLKLKSISTIVLDEVDRMCDMGFLPDIKLILSGLDSPKQSLFFSATMTNQIEELITSFMVSPEVIKLKSSRTSDNVDQNIIKFNSPSQRIDLLHEILIKEEVEKTIIFSETKRDTERLHLELSSRGFKSESIHGDKNQSARKRALKRFKENHVNVLVATDVAARGIDVADITHVINYDLPNNFDDYTHRIGRAGRAGRTGYALTFVQH